MLALLEEEVAVASAVADDEITRIGIPLYPGFDALDVAGPNQVFYFMRRWNVEVSVIGPKMGEPITSLEGLSWLPQYDFDNCPKLNVIFVPGGFGNGYNQLLKNLNDPYYAFLKKQAEGADLICSVCSGAFFLARIGLLDGYRCTTHWAYREVLAMFPNLHVEAGYPRFVIDRNRVTGGGISSGIDQAFAIAEILRGPEAAKEIQLSIQYAPDPVYDSGDPSVASPTTLYTVSNRMGTGNMARMVGEILDGT